jgi:putative membrane protein
MMHWGWESGDWWWPMGIGMLFWIVLVAVAVWFIVRAVNAPRREGSGEDAEELLRRRYAAGEIDAEEYERRLEVLRRR